MQRLKFIGLMVMSGLLLFLSGCQKDVISSHEDDYAPSLMVKNFLSDSFFVKENKYYHPPEVSGLETRTRSSHIDTVKDFFLANPSVIPHVVNSLGYPIWNVSVASNKDGHELLILPFSKLDKNKIDAVMMIHRPAGTDTMHYKTIYRNVLHTLSPESVLTKDSTLRYTSLSREFATTMILYFDYEIFSEVDCDLANTTYGNVVGDPVLESRGKQCYTVTYVHETQYWSVGGGYWSYSHSTYRYSYQILCDQIMDPGGWVGGGGPKGGINDPGGTTGNENNDNDNENNTGRTLADCRQSNPEVWTRIFELSNQNLVSVCFRPGRSINMDWNYIENELCKNDNYNLKGLNDYMEESLKGMDYIDLNEIPIHLSDCDKSQEQNIADFNKYMNENGGCSVTGFAKALSNYLGFGTILDQTVVPLSSNNRLCPNSIIVSPNEIDKDKKNVAGITNLQVSLNNGATTLTFNKIWFNIDHTRDCGIPTENLISQAINNAIQIADQRLSFGLPINPGNSHLVQNIQFLRLIENEIKQIALAESCQPKITTAENSQAHNIQTIYAAAIPSNYTNSLGKDSHCGAQFVDFSNMQTGCP